MTDNYPIPDTKRLKEDLWKKHSALTGIDINEKSQIELLKVFSKFSNEFTSFPAEKLQIQTSIMPTMALFQLSMLNFFIV